MKLQSEPFNQIRSGTKTVEVRLFDEKRQKIAIGDTIAFSHIDDTTNIIETEVINLARFNSFADLFGAYDPKTYGAKSAEDYFSMYQYYSKEDEEKYGVLAIHLQVV